MFVSMRRFLFFPVLAGMVILSCYGCWLEPNRITVEEAVIADDRLWRAWGETTIVHLSDLHITRPGKREKRLAARVRELAPDLIVITGDLAQWDSDPRPAIDYVTGLQAPLGVYCVLGDSDMATGRQQCLFCHPEGNVHALRRHPVFLKDTVQTIHLDGAGRMMAIAGFSPDDERDPAKNLLPDTPDAERETPLLVLHHFAHGWEHEAGGRPLLWLAGDTHGGQLRIPDFLWQRVRLVDYPEYRAGLFTDNRHRWLYVNRGIGTSDFFPVRIGVPPEITVIRFVEEGG
ncbi:MAG: metallophosphoesterase [Thermodesulfobacteriota bacterium]